MREWLLTFPFAPIPNSQFRVLFPFLWDSHSHAHLLPVVFSLSVITTLYCRYDDCNGFHQNSPTLLRTKGSIVSSSFSCSVKLLSDCSSWVGHRDIKLWNPYFKNASFKKLRSCCNCFRGWCWRKIKLQGLCCIGCGSSTYLPLLTNIGTLWSWAPVGCRA